VTPSNSLPPRGKAANPVIFVGGGVISSDASPELLELAEMPRRSVYASSNGRGALSDHHYSPSFRFSAPDMIAEADDPRGRNALLQPLTSSPGSEGGPDLHPARHRRDRDSLA
jgi:hypothetical protein